MNVFSESLLSIQKERGLTQVDLAKMLGVTQSTISNYVRGKIDPNLSTVIGIAEKLGVSVSRLCGENSMTSTVVRDTMAVSYADVVRAINALLDLRDDTGRIFFYRVDIDKSYMNGYNLLISAHDLTLVDFYESLKKIESLYEEGTIPENMYHDWIRDRIHALESKMLPAPNHE